MQLFQKPVQTVPTTPTPQQLLAAQVQARLTAMQQLSTQVLQFVVDASNEIYANQIGNGTAGQTFGPADYFAAVEASGAMTPVQLCAISAATLTWMQTLVLLSTPSGQTPPALPAIPPAQITLAPNADGKNIVVTGQTALQTAQATVIAARARLSAAQAKCATNQATATAAMQAAVKGGGTDTLETAVSAARTQVATDQTTVQSAAAALKTALAALPG